MILKTHSFLKTKKSHNVKFFCKLMIIITSILIFLLRVCNLKYSYLFGKGYLKKNQNPWFITKCGYFLLTSSWKMVMYYKQGHKVWVPNIVWRSSPVDCGYPILLKDLTLWLMATQYCLKTQPCGLWVPNNFWRSSPLDGTSIIQLNTPVRLLLIWLTLLHHTHLYL